jgi:lambda repressor-like predicted transcriptional regulator
VKIVGTDFSAIKLYLPNSLVHFFAKCTPRCTGLVGIYISAKWFSYFGIMLGVSFDWAYWFMTALCFRPCDYAQLWDSATGLMYSISDVGLQEQFAGHQSAKNCSWFTNNPLLEVWRNRSNPATDPFLIRVDTGVFTGSYTIDENENYVFSGKGVAGMWWLCLLPLFGWCVVAYLIFSHDHVTMFNFDEVLTWFNEHGHSPEHFRDFDPDVDDDDVTQDQLARGILADKSAAMAVPATTEVADVSNSEGELGSSSSDTSSDSDLEAGKKGSAADKNRPAKSKAGNSKQKHHLASAKAAALAAKAAVAAANASRRASLALDTAWCVCSRDWAKAQRLVAAARAAARDVRRSQFVNRRADLRARTRAAPTVPPLPPLVRHAPPPHRLAAAAAWVRDADFGGGEGPLLRATLRAATLTWAQLVAEAAASGDTVLEFNEVVREAVGLGACARVAAKGGHEGRGLLNSLILFRCYSKCTFLKQKMTLGAPRCARVCLTSWTATAAAPSRSKKCSKPRSRPRSRRFSRRPKNRLCAPSSSPPATAPRALESSPALTVCGCSAGSARCWTPPSPTARCATPPPLFARGEIYKLIDTPFGRVTSRNRIWATCAFPNAVNMCCLLS